MGNLGLISDEIRKIFSEQNKNSSALFTNSSEQKFFISELFSLKGCSKNQAVLIFQRFLSDFVFNAAEAQQAMVQGIKDNGAKKIEKAYRPKKASQNFKT